MIQHCNDCPETILGMSLSDLFRTTKAYYQNIGRQNATLLGHEFNNLFVSCYVDLFDGFASEFVPCMRLIKVSLASDPSLFNCYTLTVKATNYSGFISGYRLVLHLDNYRSDPRQYLSSEYSYDQFVGAVVLPHIRGTKGWMEENAAFLYPGTAVDLKMGGKYIQRLGPPYGSCVKRGPLKYNDQLAYTHPSCVSGCIQDEVMKVRLVCEW